MKFIKKNLKFIILFVIFVSFLVFSFSNNLNKEYIVKVNLIDKDSPDRILEVYKNNKIVSFQEIKFEDMTLCTSNNPAVYYGELLDIGELTIVLKNGDIVKAKIDLEGV